MAVDAAVAEQHRCAHAIDEAQAALSRAKAATRATIDARDAIEVEPVIARLPDDLREALAAAHYVGGIPQELWKAAAARRLGKTRPRMARSWSRPTFGPSPLGEKVHRALRRAALAGKEGEK